MRRYAFCMVFHVEWIFLNMSLRIPPESIATRVGFGDEWWEIPLTWKTIHNAFARIFYTFIKLNSLDKVADHENYVRWIYLFSAWGKVRNMWELHIFLFCFSGIALTFISQLYMINEHLECTYCIPDLRHTDVECCDIKCCYSMPFVWHWSRLLSVELAFVTNLFLVSFGYNVLHSIQTGNNIELVFTLITVVSTEIISRLNVIDWDLEACHFSQEYGIWLIFIQKFMVFTSFRCE